MSQNDDEDTLQDLQKSCDNDTCVTPPSTNIHLPTCFDTPRKAQNRV